MKTVICIILIIFSNVNISFSLHSRIINGTDADQGEFPFMVSLQTSRGVHICGSSILNPVWVLTAAHCAYGRSPNGLSVQYGSVDLSTNKENIIYIKAIYIHEKYNQSTLENDIAILKLNGFLNINENVQTIKIGVSELSPATQVTLIGWGQVKPNVPMSPRLQKVNMFIIDKVECSRIHYHTIYESNICVGVPGGGMGQCTGDSGGPLLYNGSQYSITSWSVKPCGFNPYPGIQTKVSHFIGWIEKISGIKGLIS